DACATQKKYPAALILETAESASANTAARCRRHFRWVRDPEAASYGLFGCPAGRLLLHFVGRRPAVGKSPAERTDGSSPSHRKRERTLFQLPALSRFSPAPVHKQSRLLKGLQHDWHSNHGGEQNPGSVEWHIHRIPAGWRRWRDAPFWLEKL